MSWRFWVMAVLRGKRVVGVEAWCEAVGAGH